MSLPTWSSPNSRADSLGAAQQPTPKPHSQVPATPHSHPSQRQLDTRWHSLQQAVHAATKQRIPREAEQPKQPWITQNTWALVQGRGATAREKGDRDEEVLLHKEVRKQAKRDKTQWLRDRLAQSERTLDARQKWKWIQADPDGPQATTTLHPWQRRQTRSKQASAF